MRNRILLCVLGVVIAIAYTANRFKEPAQEDLYPLPTGVSDEIVHAVMLDNLSLEEPQIILGYTGEPLNDSTLKNNPEDKSILALWNVKGSKDELPKVFVIDGPANMRAEPGGKVTATWPNGKPVRLLRSNLEWRLVSDRKKMYAWTHAKNLKEIPPKKILLDPSSDLAKGLPQSLKDYVDSNLELKITELKKISDLKNEEKLKAARIRLCPRDFTNIEKDGVFPSEVLGMVEGVSRRETLAGLCGVIIPHTEKPLKKVSLKVDQCQCYRVQMGDVDPMLVSSKETFPSKSADGRMDCSQGRFHVFCSVMEVCGEGCALGAVACPIECLDFE